MKLKTTSVAAFAVALALPALAQDGFRIGVQTGSMKTTGDSAPLATDITGGTSQFVRQINFDQPTQAPLSLDLAIVKGDDEWSLTFFTAKKKVSATFMDTTAGNGVSMGSTVLFTNAGVSGSRELKATLIDLAWKRALVKGDRGTFSVSSGLRYGRQSDERFFQELDPAGAPATRTGHIDGEGTGFGLTAGIHGRMNFSNRVWLTSGFVAALLDNTVKTKDNTVSTSGVPTVTFANDDLHQSLLQTDAYLRLNVNFVKTFNGYLGYEVRDFNRAGAGATTPNFFSNTISPGTPSGFGLSGFTLGLSYTF